MQPFIPREGVYRKNKTKSIRGTIKDNYDEPESEEEGKISPGPGHYQTPNSTFKTRSRPQSLQYFGSNVKRFNDKPVGSELGPGQYKPKPLNKSMAQKVGASSAFKAQPRNSGISASLGYDSPGPGEYLNDSVI